jgi:hypothetical protein
MMWDNKLKKDKSREKKKPRLKARKEKLGKRENSDKKNSMLF